VVGIAHMTLPPIVSRIILALPSSSSSCFISSELSCPLEHKQQPEVDEDWNVPSLVFDGDLHARYASGFYNAGYDPCGVTLICADLIPGHPDNVALSHSVLTYRQGLTLVHCSAQRKHFLWVRWVIEMV